MSLDPFKAIQTVLGINPRSARIAAGGFLVLTLAIAAWQRIGDKSVTLWEMLGALVGLMVLMIVLSFFPAMMARLSASVLGLCFCAWLVAATAQVIADDQLPFAPNRCLVRFGFADACGRSTGNATAGLPSEAVVTAEAAAPSPAPVSAQQSGARIFIQFAGFKREDVIELAADLGGQGWKVEGAARGGERTGAADGLNEVRYFNPGDKANAEALALSVSAGMAGQPPIAVKDLSATKYAQAETGLLEVWISGRSE